MRPIAVAGVVVCLTLAPLRAWGQAPAQPQSDAADSDADATPNEAPAADAEPADPTTRNLEVTGFQCEAVSSGRGIKDVPADTQVDAISFLDPPPVTFRLPDQRREAVTECSLRASGLTVRVDPTRKAIILLPSGTGSPELPNPKIRVSLKIGGEPPKRDP